MIQKIVDRKKREADSIEKAQEEAKKESGGGNERDKALRVSDKTMFSSLGAKVR